MKKVLVAAAFAALFLAQGAKAQTNFQTFYDFGRKHFTTTLEGFHQDDWGNTFFFIDYDYNNRNLDDKVISPRAMPEFRREATRRMIRRFLSEAQKHPENKVIDTYDNYYMPGAPTPRQ